MKLTVASNKMKWRRYYKLQRTPSRSAAFVPPSPSFSRFRFTYFVRTHAHGVGRHKLEQQTKMNTTKYLKMLPELIRAVSTFHSSLASRTILDFRMETRIGKWMAHCPTSSIFTERNKLFYLNFSQLTPAISL